MKIQGKTFVVTGGGNGIGREVVLQLLARGARVAALDLSQEGLNETSAAAKSDRLSIHQVNIADLSQVTSSKVAINAAHGLVDGIINVAGIIQPFVRVNDLTFDQIKKVMDVNFYGLLHVTKTYLPELISRPEAHIANVCSMGGFVPVPGQSIYGASKAAVKLLTEGLHSELQGTGVGVTTIFPGAIGTNIALNSGIMTQQQMTEMASKAGPARKTTSVQVAGKAIIDGIEKKKFHVLIGQDAKTMYFLSRLMPERAANLIYKNMKDLLG
jgi:short-subunit dehydrogenase